MEIGLKLRTTKVQLGADGAVNAEHKTFSFTKKIKNPQQKHQKPCIALSPPFGTTSQI